MVKHGQDGRPARLAGRRDGNARHVQDVDAAEAVGHARGDGGAEGRRLGDAPPWEPQLPLEPYPEVLGGAVRVERVQLVVDGAGLGDQPAEPDCRYGEREPCCGEVGRVHASWEEELRRWC